MKVVVDASYAGAWVLPDEFSKEAEFFLESILDGREEMVTTTLWHYEMCNLLIMAHRRKRIAEEAVRRAIGLLGHIPMEIFDHQQTLWQERIHTLAARFSLSAYDASYLELADRLQCPLRSHDRSLLAAGRQIGVCD